MRPAMWMLCTSLSLSLPLAAGCTQFQGFLYSPAVDPRTFEQRMLAPPASARLRAAHPSHAGMHA